METTQNQPRGDKRLLNEKEAADFLGICKRSFQTLYYSGLVPVTKLNGMRKRLFDKKDLHKLIDDSEREFYQKQRPSTD